MADAPRIRKLKEHPEIKPAFHLARRRRLESDSTIDGSDVRKVLFIRYMSGVPSVLTRKQVRGNSKQINFAVSNFDFDSAKPLFRSRNTFYYGVDIEKGQVMLSNSNTTITPELRYKVLKKGIVSQLVSGLDVKGFGQIILYILLAGSAFGCLGYIIGNVLPIG